jgi:hypothetical protein
MRPSAKIAAACVLVLMLGIAYRVAFPAPALAPESAELEFVKEVKPVPTTTGPEGLTLHGTVVDASGAPVGNATVELSVSQDGALVDRHCEVCELLTLDCRGHDETQRLAKELKALAGAPPPGMRATTDAAGRFAFEHLLGDRFRLVARAANFGSTADNDAAPGVAATLRLPPPRILNGFLRDERGDSLEGEVFVASRTTGMVSRVSANGAFQVSGLGEGPFALLAQAKGKAPKLIREVNVSDGEQSLTLDDLRSLTVSLRSNGKPVDGTVQLRGSHFERAVTTSNGVVAVEGLPKFELEVTASSAALASVTRALALTEISTSLELTLEPGARINVVVTDEASQPVKQVELTLNDERLKSVAQRTLKNGELGTLGPVPAGNYSLFASAKGFVARTVSVAVEQAEQTVEVVLEPSLTLQGTVVDELGRAAAGVSVLLRPTDEAMVTDKSGAFEFEVPSTGQYELGAHHSDFGGVELKVSAPKQGVVLRLERRAELEVKVTSTDGPVDGAHVMLGYGEGNFRSDRPSGADGVVMMSGLPSGSYDLTVIHPQFLTSTPERIELTDQAPSKRAVVLKRGHAISGKVTDPTGKPVEGVALYFMPRVAQETVSDAKGEFSLSAIDPANEYVIRTANNFELVGPQTFEVKTLANEKLTVVVKPFAKFTGRVLAQGQPVRQFTVNGMHDVTAEDGRFELPLKVNDDEISLEISAPKFESDVFTVPAKPSLGDFELRPLSVLRGKVVDARGAPVVDAEVSCPMCPAGARTSNDGNFTLSRSGEGEQVEITARKGKASGKALARKNQSDGVAIVIQSGVRVFGVLSDRQGKPAPGALLRLTELPDYAGDSVTVVADAQGHYETVVPPGRYAFSLPSEPDDAVVLQRRLTGTEMRIDFGGGGSGGSLEVFSNASDLPDALTLVDAASAGLEQPVWSMLAQDSILRSVFRNIPPGRYMLKAEYDVGEEELVSRTWAVSIPADKVLHIGSGVARPGLSDPARLSSEGPSIVPRVSLPSTREGP